nr:nickel pincer cofactor biosynthesis protein LarC [uncultured Carboxylicivirga sp.]
MSKKLYLECYSGISGDMTVAALLDLGADQQVLLDALNSLPVDGFKIEISRVKKAGIDACDFNVILDEKHENHDHDMAYLHGDQVKEHDHSHHHHHHDHSHSHSHDEHSHHNHDHDHQHQYQPTHEGHHHHEHRGLKEIAQIINESRITAKAKQIALDIFQVIGEAEAKAHAMSVDEVHFHEVGAVDSIVDIVAVAVCIDNLGIEEVIVPVLYEGTGTVRCQHGILPIPVPAVSNIASQYGLNLKITSTQGEFITPTGAAIVAALKSSDILPNEFTIEKIGLGAGKRNYERASLLRAILIKDEKKADQDIIYKLESNIDDCSGEVLGYVMDQLLEVGALDVNYSPIFMKKNRPAYQINIICKEENIDHLEQILFEETTTIGIRRQKMERTLLPRELKNIQTSLGEAKVKVCQLKMGEKVYPEYESVVELSQKHKLPFNEVYQIIIKEYNA